MGEAEGKKGEEGKIRQEEERKKTIQPINNSIRGTLKQELVNYPIYPHCPTDQLESCILGIAKDEMIPVEAREARPADTPRQRGHVVDIGFLHHGGHRLFHPTFGELELRMFVRNCFKVKVRAVKEGFKEGKRAGVGQCCCAGMMSWVRGNGEVGAGGVGVGVGFYVIISAGVVVWVGFVAVAGRWAIAGALRALSEGGAHP